jgi:hypothetical protein
MGYWDVEPVRPVSRSGFLPPLALTYFDTLIKEAYAPVIIQEPIVSSANRRIHARL